MTRIASIDRADMDEEQGRAWGLRSPQRLVLLRLRRQIVHINVAGSTPYPWYSRAWRPQGRT
jgi:hypothetical protein